MVKSLLMDILGLGCLVAWGWGDEAPPNGSGQNAFVYAPNRGQAPDLRRASRLPINNR
jgi:hypothetical protein